MLLTCVLGEALQSWASAHGDGGTSASAAEQEPDQMLLMCAVQCTWRAFTVVQK